jgi:magnesium chelatase subunit D
VQPAGSIRVARDRTIRRSTGRRSFTITDRRRGWCVRARAADDAADDLALDATIRAAAGAQSWRPRTDGAPLVQIRREDLRRNVRVAPESTVIVFVVDASWSMAVSQRIRAARGAILTLLEDAYQRRERVGLVTFRKNRADVLLAPTGAVAPARRALESLSIGGKTPLSAGLLAAARLFRRERLRQPDARALMVLLTDGAANVALGDSPPLAEAWRVADRIRRAGVRSVVIDAERRGPGRGLTQALASHLGAPALVTLDFRADLLYRAVRRALDLA